MSELVRIDDTLWEIPVEQRPDMRVPARVFADAELLDAIRQDLSLEQLANVATLPGIDKLPRLAARWQVHRTQTAELLSDAVIDALAQRLRRHLKGLARDPSEIVSLPSNPPQ